MSTIAIALFQLSLLAPTGQSYEDAYREHMETGCPLVVLVGSDGCRPCRWMKQTVIPQARGQGVLDEVAFAQVNMDREPELAQQLLRGGSIPQLIVFHKLDGRWQRRELSGAQNVAAIHELVEAPKRTILIEPPMKGSILISRR
jgi:thioredoxin-like negative regulator of GroEL